MRFSVLEIPPGATLWMRDKQFLASADLHFKVGVPRDLCRGFAPIVHGDRAASSHRAWMVQAKGHWLRLLTKVESCSEPGLALWSALLFERVRAVRVFGIVCLVLICFSSNLASGSLSLQYAISQRETQLPLHSASHTIVGLRVQWKCIG